MTIIWSFKIQMVAGHRSLDCNLICLGRQKSLTLKIPIPRSRTILMEVNLSTAVVEKNVSNFGGPDAMRINKLFLVTLLLCCCGSQSTAQDPASANISLQISSMTRRNRPPDNRRRGLLNLEFVNSSEKKASIPVFRILGKDPVHVLNKMGISNTASNFEVNGREEVSYGGDCCTVNYEWTDKTGKEVLDGAYDLIRPDLKVGSKSKVSLFIPIEMPPTPSLYTLTVRFDNRLLEEEVRSYNDADPDFRVTFFKAMDHALIKIPSSSFR
jgi:hypothetical protein